MNIDDVRLQELQAQMEEWQAELDLLETWPATRIEHKERIEALREKLRAGAETVSAWHAGRRPDIP
jgi:outer membrane protein TolC